MNRMSTMIRTYSELRRLTTFEERFRYLSLRGEVGASTFGYDRWINQQFYRSTQWRQLRNQLITRDKACDLGIDDHDIYSRAIIHHMNPMTVEDILDGNEDILNPEFLITTIHDTHNAIHYGDESLLRKPFIPRQRGDTKLW